ncbi:MAG: STAS/SEC14 domain-containing protein [Nitrospira sp.]|nr:STAS/SEC14 domain-containing protein [Nitrospira sp.]
MIEVLEEFPPTVMGFAYKNQVTKGDYEHVFIPTVAQALADYQKVRLYFQIDPNFSGVEPRALWEDFKLGMEYLFRWDRIAVVTDVEWIRQTFKAFACMIPCAARVFRLEEVSTAKDWVVERAAEQEPAILMDRTEKFLIAVDESAASLKAVSYVSQILRGRTDVHVRLLHVLPPIPPGLLEFGGAEHPQLEQRLSGELRQDQTRWIETAKRNAHASLDKALAILLQGGLSPNEVSTSFSSPIHRPDIAHEMLKVAQTWKCGTLVVGRHTRSWIREIRSTHVGEDLVRKGQGFAIWVIE